MPEPTPETEPEPTPEPVKVRLKTVHQELGFPGKEVDIPDPKYAARLVRNGHAEYVEKATDEEE